MHDKNGSTISACAALPYIHIEFSIASIVMSTIQCRGTEIGEIDAKNDVTEQERGTFLHHERKIQNGF
ncbi:MAG TPA: hypothetical protein C5S51_07510 [Methanosarcinaceae archaeon]|nr:hypothetical protein [Methanosarcinaceae archaeon]